MSWVAKVLRFPTNTKEHISETHQLGQAIFGVSLHYTKMFKDLSKLPGGSGAHL